MPDSTDSESLLTNAARRLERRDAEILLADAWQITRSQLLVRGGEAVPADVAARFTASCERRANGEPVAYLLGRREFWSLSFDVNAAVLVPRPETELLVQLVLDLVSAADANVVDLGTGSGAIAIALASERAKFRVVATDASADALEVARRNGARLAPGRIEWLLGDWFTPIAGRVFDVIASNPPYVAGDDPVLGSDGLKYEPRAALTPGGDGYAALATLINSAPGHLKPGGRLALEHGTAQGETLRSRLVARGFTHVTSHRDLAGHERVTTGLWPS